MSTTPPGDPEQPSWQPPPMAPPPSYPPAPPPYGAAPAPGYADNPYGYAPQPTPGYGEAPYGYGYGYPQRRDHPQGTTILVLGVLGLVLCQLLAPVAWIMGNTAIREIDANPEAYGNRGTVQAGRICGIVGSVIIILSLVVVIFAVVLALAAGTSST